MKLSGDIKSAKLLWIKGGLFVVAGTLAAAGILAESFSWQTALLLALCIWSFSRAYYFAFYVIEHYIDSSFKFAGLFSVIRYLMQKKRMDS